MTSLNERLDILRDNLKRSQDLTDNMVTNLDVFDNRVQQLETTLLPIYQQTELLDRTNENISCSLTVFEGFLAKFDIAETVEQELQQGFQEAGYDAYLAAVDRIHEAQTFFQEHRAFKSAGDALERLKHILLKAKTDMEAEFARRFSKQCNNYDPNKLSRPLPEELEAMPPSAVADLSKLSERLHSIGENSYLKVYREIRSQVLLHAVNRLHPEKMFLENESGMYVKGQHRVLFLFDFLLILLESERTFGRSILHESQFDVTFGEVIEPVMDLLYKTIDLNLIQNRRIHFFQDRMFIMLDMIGHLEPIEDRIRSAVKVLNGKHNSTMAGIIQKLKDATKQSLSQVLAKTLEDNSRNVSKDGALHEVTVSACNFGLRLLLFKSTVAHMLPPLPSHHNPTGDEPLTPLGQLIANTLNSLEGNFEAKAKHLKGSLIDVFMLNNHQYILKRIEESNLVPHVGKGCVKKYEEKIAKEKELFLKNSWEKSLEVLLDNHVPAPKGTELSKSHRHQIKSKFLAFNEAFDGVYYPLRAAVVNDDALRATLRTNSLHILCPAYEKFLDRYEGTKFCQNMNKYMKYTLPLLKSSLEKLFSASQVDNIREAASSVASTSSNIHRQHAGLSVSSNF